MMATPIQAPPAHGAADLDLTPAQLGLLGATFLASAVEIVETFTILLAMGLTRGWRSTIAGALSALVVLVVATAVAGYALLRFIPESLLQLLIGTLLLIFGLQWLRKAILRSAGRKALPRRGCHLRGRGRGRSRGRRRARSSASTGSPSWSRSRACSSRASRSCSSC